MCPMRYFAITGMVTASWEIRGDRKVEKDFRKINEANFKLIDFVFNDMEKEKSGTHQDKHQGGALLTGDFLTNVVDTVVDITWQLTPQDINDLVNKLLS